MQASETRQNLNKLKASYLKLSQESASKAAEIESMTVADQEREQQLRALLVDKEEQEYRMKTTIEQQSKLITHAMHSRTPPKESKLKKVCVRARVCVCVCVCVCARAWVGVFIHTYIY